MRERDRRRRCRHRRRQLRPPYELPLCCRHRRYRRATASLSIRVRYLNRLTRDAAIVDNAEEREGVRGGESLSRGSARFRISAPDSRTERVPDRSPCDTPADAVAETFTEVRARARVNREVSYSRALEFRDSPRRWCAWKTPGRDAIVAHSVSSSIDSAPSPTNTWRERRSVGATLRIVLSGMGASIIIIITASRPVPIIRGAR